MAARGHVNGRGPIARDWEGWSVAEVSQAMPPGEDKNLLGYFMWISRCGDGISMPFSFSVL